MENELRKNESSERSHGKKKRIPLNLDFTVDDLLADPEKKQGDASGFDHEN